MSPRGVRGLSNDTLYNAYAMLRSLIIALLLADAALSIYLSDSRMASGLLIIAALNAYLTRARIKAYVTLQWELNRLAMLVARTAIAITAIVIIIAGSSMIGRHDAATACLLLGTALVPVGLMPVIHFIAQRTHNSRGLHNFIKIIRCALTLAAGKLCLVLSGLGGFWLSQTAPAITGPQLLVIDGALVLSMIALGQDMIRHKLKRETPAVLNSKLTSFGAIGSFIGFGLLAAALAYGNYLLFFARHHLSPAYLDPTLPLYHQATALTCLTLILCLYIYLLFERADVHEKFFTNYLLSNKKLLRAFAVSLFVVAAITYIPWLQTFFAAGPLSIVDWLTALLAAGLYTGFRLLQRHTRKHTRHAVLRLHREVHTARYY